MDGKEKVRRVNILMTRFLQLYEDRYGKKPRFNRHTEKWGFNDLIDDLGSESQPTLEYYFKLKRNHSPQDFLRNYHELNEWRREDEEDALLRRQLAEETKQRVEEHRARWQQKPST